MTGYILPGICGLLLGLTLHWTGFTQPEALPRAMALRRSHPLRSGLHALGSALTLTALLCWLAVIDVDTIEVLPLTAGALAGGAIFGAAAGLCGYTPVTAFAGLGGGSALESLCTIAGCFAATLMLPWLSGPFTALQSAGPQSATTLFRMTLDEPFLLDGGFLAQGCVGFLLTAIAVCIPSPRPAAAEPPSADASARTAIPPPEEAPDETFVAILPGEEPLVVDTLIDEAAVPDESAGEFAPSDDQTAEPDDLADILAVEGAPDESCTGESDKTDEADETSEA